jgi:KaiC/GvpD/RAD55 family RecA-like ATPase
MRASAGWGLAGQSVFYEDLGLADNVILLSHYRDHATMTRSLAVVKTRASSHDPAMRPFSIGPSGITLADPAAESVQGAGEELQSQARHAHRDPQ